MEEKETQNKKGYASRFGLLCVLIGGSVGTGNIWRFPRLVASSGGAAFIVAMIICIFLVTLPILYVENFLGRSTRHSAAGAFRDTIGPKYTWMGTVPTIIYFMMTSYYMVVLAWCVRYTVMSATGSYFGLNKLNVFNTVTNGDMGTVLCWLFAMVCLVLAMKRQSGVEKASKFLIPALFVMLVFLMVYSLTRPGAVSGLKYAFTFDPKAFFDSETWLQAITQCAWSIGPGTTMIIATSKFNGKNDDIALNSHIQSYGDMTVAMMGTLVVLPCLFAFSSSTADATAICASGSNGLTFIGLAGMFESMPAGRLIGTMFFLCLSFAAFSSAAVQSNAFSNALIDVGFSRTKAVLIVVGAMTVVGIPSILSQNFLTNQDNTWGIGLIIGIAFIGFAAFKFGAEKIRTQFINPVSDIKVGKSFDVLAGVVAPLSILVVLGIWCVRSIGWDPNWWDPFATNGFGTMIYQWAIVFVISIALNKKINKSIKKNYFNGESFDDIPEEILKEV